MVLGWALETRRLIVKLPGDKFIAWSVDIAEILRTGTVTFGDLESCVGRLNHAAYVIPLSRHFLGRLYARITPAKPKRQQLTLSQVELDDLKTWLHFLDNARSGISMNLLTHRTPTNIGISDSCPYGLGGFTWHGRAWRLRIPTESPLYGLHTANNALEFLAMVVNVWLMVIDSPAPYQCFLGLGDSTSAIGWLFHSSSLKGNSSYTVAVTIMARKMARILLKADHCLFGQHLPGSLNTVADQLSFTSQTREGKINMLAHDSPCNAELTDRFHTLMPQLIPEPFAISQLPDEILSFVVLVLRTMESSMTPSAKQPSSAKTGHGVVGSVSATPRESISRSSIVFPSRNKNYSSVRSSPVIGQQIGPTQETFVESIRSPYKRRLYEMPQATWLRRFGCNSGKVPFTSREAPSYSPP